MVILAHHEMFMQYAVSLFIGGIVCFCWLFPMIRQWLKDLVKKLEDANKRMEQEREDVLQRRQDDQDVVDELYMTQDEIKSAYKREGSPKTVKAEQQEENWLDKPSKFLRCPKCGSNDVNVIAFSKKRTWLGCNQCLKGSYIKEREAKE